MRTSSWMLPVLLLAGCIAPPGPVERLKFAAHEMNSATRFGRMDIAAGHVRPAVIDDFMRRHADWGRQTRIVDLEVEGMRLITKETAEVRIAVFWHRLDESTMRTSLLAQKWTREEDDWQLSEELQVGGASGLFETPEGDEVAPHRPPPGMEHGLTTQNWQ